MIMIISAEETRQCCMCNEKGADVRELVFKNDTGHSTSIVLCKSHMDCLLSALKMDLGDYGVPEKISYYSKDYECPKVPY